MKVRSSYANNLRQRKPSPTKKRMGGAPNLSTLGNRGAKAKNPDFKDIKRDYTGLSACDEPRLGTKSPFSDISDEIDLGTSPDDVTVLGRLLNVGDFFRTRSPVCPSPASIQSAATTRSFDYEPRAFQSVISKLKMFGPGTNCHKVFENWLLDAKHPYVEEDVVNFLAELYKDEFGQMTINKQELLQQEDDHSVVVIIIDRLRTNSFDPEKCIIWQGNSYIDHILNLKQAFVDLDAELTLCKG